MSDNEKPSRRDWFRLSKNRSPENRKQELLGTDLLTNDTPGDASSKSVAQEIPHPPNHDGMDLSLLPPMREAILGRAQIENLFQDIQTFASQVQLMQRAKHMPRATAKNVETADQLQLAKRSLVAGEISRLQVRYCWDDALWIDTLESTSEGFRLVRIRHLPPNR